MNPTRVNSSSILAAGTLLLVPLTAECILSGSSAMNLTVEGFFESRVSHSSAM